MKEEKIVSIIVPVYNHEKFVRDCLESIIVQTYENIEVLICDDASSDRSWNIIQQFKSGLLKRFKRVVIIQNSTNMGITVTLNRLIEKSKGNYVKIIASDDLLPSNCISTFVSCFSKDINIDVVVSNGITISEDDHYPVQSYGDKIYIDSPDFTKKDLFIRLYYFNFIFAPGVMIKKEVFNKYGLYDETIAIEDWEYWLRISKDCKVYFKYLDEHLVYYRKSDNSMTALAANNGLENRRKHIFDAEVSIIDKYGIYVSKKQYLQRKMSQIETEREIAFKYHLEELKNTIEKEWKKIPIISRMRICEYLGVRKLLHIINRNWKEIGKK